MFASVRDTAHENSGLIPKRFVWPYGGRKLLLSGSFTRWSDHIPMSPMEGCPTVFQVICSLTPGYHQYKFNVDGEWRHDEQQPVVSGNYGVANTIFLARESDILPAIVSTEACGRSHMDVDNDVLGHVEVNLRMSKSDLEVSRHLISVFLSTHTAYELLPESGKVIALDINLPVKQAFHVLYEQGIPMAPLWDFCRSQFVGVLSAMDFILILKELDNNGSNLTEEQLETHTIAAWKEGKKQRRIINSSEGSYPWHFVHVSALEKLRQKSHSQAEPHDCLKDVALKILQNEVATVPIVRTSSQDGSSPQLLHLASLSGILKCMCRHLKHSFGSLPILQLPISTIPLGTWVPEVGESNRQPLAMLRPNVSLGSALSLLLQAEVSSIPNYQSWMIMTHCLIFFLEVTLLHWLKKKLMHG